MDRFLRPLPGQKMRASLLLQCLPPYESIYGLATKSSFSAHLVAYYVLPPKLCELINLATLM